LELSLFKKGRKMKFERIVVFGDFHGDLDTMLASLADKGLIRYGSHKLDIVRFLSNYPF
jgi:hypothetical protein